MRREIAMHKERLEELRALLGTVDEDHFNLSYWGCLGESEDEPVEQEDVDELGETDPSYETYEWAGILDQDKVKKLHCGFAACAMGWAALHPPFKEAGLELSLTIDDDGFQSTGISYDGNYGYLAAASFFDIPHVDAEYLFSPQAYGLVGRDITPAMVAQRITELLVW
jgi:hypothetical protein